MDKLNRKEIKKKSKEVWSKCCEPEDDGKYQLSGNRYIENAMVEQKKVMEAWHKAELKRVLEELKIKKTCSHVMCSCYHFDMHDINKMLDDKIKELE